LVKPWDQTQPTLWIAPWENNDPLIAAEYEFAGSMQAVLRELSAVKMSGDPDWGEKRVKDYWQVQSANPLPVPAKGYIRPGEVLDAIRRCVPRDTLVTTDVGSHKIFTSLYWPAYTPNRFLVSNGLSSMGFGLPAAIAACRHLKEPVVSIIGDGGMAMVVGELGLLKELNLPVIIILMRDDALDLIRSAQTRAGKPVFGTEFTNPDYGLISQGYGIDFYQISAADECEHAIRTACSNGRPAIIEALIDPASYPTTPAPK
ncbi:MAG: thiamine pyrophosphate-dependent enzyme, partial [Anaerolineaceae bacterium]|nr:thiamine pyrophosphate-dependent enzyme [Anaerolineaceae bacterium]